MKITEITYSRGQTYQIRQYEPTNLHFSAKAEITQLDKMDEAYKDLKFFVDRELELALKMLQEPQRVARAGAKEVIIRDNKHEPSPF